MLCASAGTFLSEYLSGHEKFVRTMVAGVGGMGLAMLVIAADEGAMPQTREYYDISGDNRPVTKVHDPGA